MKTIRIVFIFLLCFIVEKSFAQISEGGIPPSFLNNLSRNTVAIKTMPRVNVDSLINADEVETARERNLIRPFQFGYAIKVNLNLENSGTWETMENGDKIWRLKIYSEGAYSINLIFDKFWLPKGAQFFVYNENDGDKRMILGAFTARTSNNEHNVFATDLVQSNTIVLEYYEPVYAKGGVININRVIHGYINTFSDGLGNSANCNIDVNCSQGNDWCVEKRAVAMLLVNDNTAFCTGCLINNVRGDFKPYLLTANHCLGSNTNTWIFRFHYWKPTCNGGNPNRWYSITGATLRASHAATDFALLELSSKPSFSPITYAGWDRNAVPTQNATAIHHPRGDAMKISYDAHPVVAVSWLSGAQNHWRATFDQGIVQHGSSGSPLFNQNRRIVGQLHGNQNNQCGNQNIDNNCHCKQTPIGEYGRFDVSWNGGGTPSTRLRDWLDPDNTGAMTVDAAAESKTFLVNKTLTGTHKFSAVNQMHIEGNVQTNNLSPVFICPTANNPFTTEPGSNVTFKAKSITIGPGTTFKAGSIVSIIATNIPDCNGFTEGDFYLCLPANMLLNNKSYSPNMYDDTPFSDFENNEIDYFEQNEQSNSFNDFTSDFKLYPNPNNGTFQIDANFPVTDITNIKVTNLLGNIVYETSNLVSNTVQLQTSIGTYFVVLTLKDGTVLTKKMVITQ